MNKRVLAIHDLSGLGNTSLMAIIPIMYRFGLKVCALPTSLLSANTCYEGYRMLDTGAFMQQCLEHWQQMKLRFAAIYSGFLAGKEQVDTVLSAIDSFGKERCLIVIDPVMGDNGELYSCYDESMILAMRTLVARADIICPNYTEACFLAGKDLTEIRDEAALHRLCRDLHALGSKEVIITSVPRQNGDSEVVYSAAMNATPQHFPYKYLPCFYTGTGDIFSALMVAYRLRKVAIGQAIPRAIELIYHAIELSQKNSQPGAEGVNLEQILCQE
jgi:pyridoxine kinase